MFIPTHFYSVKCSFTRDVNDPRKWRVYGNVADICFMQLLGPHIAKLFPGQILATFLLKIFNQHVRVEN